LVAGIAIYDAAGEYVYGDNTNIERLAVENAPDHDCSATFILDGGLPPGSYAVTAALSELRRVGFYFDWIDSAATFEVPAGDHASGKPTLCLRRFESAVGPALTPPHCGGDFVKSA